MNICTVVGVQAEIENTASYLADWMTVIRSDRKAIFRAAADAPRAADYILGFHPDYAAAVRAAAAVGPGAGDDDNDVDPGEAVDDAGDEASSVATAA